MTTDPLDGLEQLRRIIDEQPEPAPESVMLGLDYCYAEWVAERARHAEEVAALRAQLREVTMERDEAVAHRLNVATDGVSDTWRPIETAPRDGTEVALLFAREETVTFGVLSTWPRVRAAFFTGSDWSIPYYANNPPIGWTPLPAPPADVPRGCRGTGSR